MSSIANTSTFAANAPFFAAQMPISPAQTPEAHQLTLDLDLPPAHRWRLPEARSDRETRLAVLLRNILWQHEAGGCRASNEWFASNETMGLRQDVATVRRNLAYLQECGIIRRDYDDFGQRTIVPLVTIEDLIAAGWEALARAIVGMKQWSAEIRNKCRELLRGLGKWQKPASRLAETDPSKPSSSGRNCAAIARRIARPFPYKGREAQKTTTDTSANSEATVELSSASVAVSASHNAEPLVATLPESAQLAIEAGLSLQRSVTITAQKPLDAIKSAIKAAKAYAATHEVKNWPGLLTKAISEGWLPPAPKSDYASDRGERAYPVTKAPKGFVLPGSEAKPRQAESPIKADVEPFQVTKGYEQMKADMIAKRKGLRY